MTDSDLIEAIRRGDRDAFSVLVTRYQRLVEAAVYVTVRRRDFIEDVVQDTFLTAWRTIERLRDPTRVRAWLYGIARNQACKARRRLQPEVQLEDVATAATPFEAVSSQQLNHRIGDALASLPARYREPLVLFYYEQCSVKEVAETLALREEAVMQRISRARRSLGETLATTVEVELERKPSRAAVAAGVLALLPLRVASSEASPLSVALVANASSMLAATARICRHVASWFATRWRLLGAGVGSVAAIAIVIAAVSKSNAVAARASARSASDDHGNSTSKDPATDPQPELPEPETSAVRRNMVIATLDPVESCARAVRSLVLGAHVGSDRGRAITLDGVTSRFRDGTIVLPAGADADGKPLYFEPDPELVETANDIAARVGSTCDVGTWPELYVICEGTVGEIREGNVSCYPYDPFADT